MSFSALSIGVSALNAAQREMEVAAHNVANVNTEGYSRQQVQLATARPTPGTYGSRGDGQRGMGVKVEDVVRVRNSLIDVSYRSEAANQAAWDARSQVLSRAEQVMGPLDGGAPKALAEFWKAWDQLARYPGDVASRRGVVDAGRALAQSLNSAASGLEHLVDDTKAQIRDSVDEVNGLADQVAKLNEAIHDASVGQQSPNDLMDERDRLVDRLAALTGATTVSGEFNRVDVFVGNQALVRGATAEKLAFDGTKLTVAGGSSPVEIAVGGRVGALQGLVRDDIPALQGSFDQLANGLRDLINGTHKSDPAGTPPRSTYDLDGNPGVAFFAEGSIGARDLRVNDVLVDNPRKLAAGLTSSPNDANNAVAIAALRTAPTNEGISVQDSMTQLAGRLGSLSAEANRRADDSGVSLDGLKRDRADASSVSIDEELANLVRFQRSYEAAAKVITVVDAMLDKLINSTGLVGR